jgi:hypothetical protein
MLGQILERGALGVGIVNQISGITTAIKRVKEIHPVP